MMNQFFYRSLGFLLVLFFCVTSVYSAAIENKYSLPSYEQLTYVIKWIGIPAGHLTATIESGHVYNGKQAYKIEVIAKTNAFVSKIYHIDDHYEVYIDSETLNSLELKTKRNEGSYHKDSRTFFDQNKNIAYFENYLDESKKEIPIPDFIKDTIAASYYFRTLPIELNKPITYEVYNSEKIYDLVAMVTEERFITTAVLGRKKAFKLVPYAELNGERVKEGRVSGFFTSDYQRIPLVIYIKAPLFTMLKATLVDYKRDE